ncbi:hypothetical protein Q7P37_006286 [Cladosporium fusiforme]
MATPLSNKPAPLACDTCRRKHLKCDGVSPVCGRCVHEALVCTYTASRRGLGRRNRRGTASVRSASTGPADPSGTNPGLFTPTNGNLTNGTSIRFDRSIREAIQPNDEAAALNGIGPSISPTPWALDPMDRERLLGHFYSRFYPTHPFLAPKPFYAAQAYPGYLDLVVCFVGHHYCESFSNSAELTGAVSLVMAEVDEHTVHRVQALILYAIILHASHRPKEAGSCILRAARIALDIGLNEPAFARGHASDSPVAEESCRRTWWELHIVDVYLAAIHRQSTFATSSARSLPLLPSAQCLYEAGRCDSDPPTIQAFDNRVFSMQPRSDFSTYCYRIEAIRIVRRVLARVSTDDAQPDDIQALDNALTSWEYNLPAPCMDVLDTSGEVDLMLFQARCFISCASIIFHFPRSELPPTVPRASDIACAKSYPQLAPSSRDHTSKAIAASKILSNLATVPWPLERHSPFFICGLVLGCIVQLAAASVHLHKCGLDCLQQHRDRVILMLGALRRLGARWTLAHNALRGLKSVAEIVFTVQDESSAPTSGNASLHDSAMDIGDNPGNLSWFDLFSMDDMQGNLFAV